MSQPLNHAVGRAHFAEIAVCTGFVPQFREDQSSLLVAGEGRGNLEDVVEAGPDAVCFATHGVGEDFDEEEEGGVPLLHGADVPCPRSEDRGGCDLDGVFELLGAGGEDDLPESVWDSGGDAVVVAVEDHDVQSVM